MGEQGVKIKEGLYKSVEEDREEHRQSWIYGSGMIGMVLFDGSVFGKLRHGGLAWSSWQWLGFAGVCEAALGVRGEPS